MSIEAGYLMTDFDFLRENVSGSNTNRRREKWRICQTNAKHSELKGQTLRKERCRLEGRTGGSDVSSILRVASCRESHFPHKYLRQPEKRGRASVSAE